MKINYKKILTSPWTALITLALVLSVRIADPSFVESVRLRYFDELIKNQPTQETSIVTINIDEQALNKYGQWPLPRGQYAKIIKDLYEHGAGLVVMPIMMSEPDRMGQDGQLAYAMKEFPVILGSNPSSVSKNIPKKQGLIVIGPSDAPVPVYSGIVANIPALENSAIGVGTINTQPEIDGVNRRVPLVSIVKDKSGEFMYPSLAMEVLRVAAGDTTQQVKVNDNGIEKMRIPKFGPIVTDNRGRVWIDWSQKSKSYNLTNLPQDLNGAIVIIGPTAAGVSNPVPTAVGAVYPHELQAGLISTLITGTNIERPDYADGLELLIIVVGGLLILFLSRWVYVGITGTVVIIGGGIAGSIYCYSNYHQLIDITLLSTGLVLVALHAYGVKFVSEFLQKQAIKKQFAGYCSKEVVEMLQKDPDLIKRGVKKEISICFSDLRGFTPLGESFGDDVGGLTKVMNGYMDAITQPILEANGMVIKYIGDASMHIHNSPIDDPDHPKTAVAVGLKMVKAVKEYSKLLEAQGRPGVKMGAGINTGLGYIGEMGSTQRHSYDVLGDAVSTTARIESKCKEYGCVLLVGEHTVERCKDDFFFLKIDDLAVKGKSVGVGIYTVLDDITTEYVMAGETHEEMHRLYRSQKFDQAIKLCKQLKGEFDGKMDSYYEMWIERCEYQKTQDLPKDWNGTFIATTK